MPNHCSNHLTVKGPDHDVSNFWDSCLGDDGEHHLNNLIPMPQEIKDSEDWWNWANENWGTKWGAYGEYVNNNEPGLLEIGYDTAWSPLSVEFWEKVAKRFPNLTFIVVYHEEGLDFAGGHRVRDGRITIRIEEGCLSDHYPSEEEFGSVDDYWEATVVAVDNFIDQLRQELAS